MKSVRFSISLVKDLYEKLETAAKAESRTLAGMARVMIEEGLKARGYL